MLFNPKRFIPLVAVILCTVLTLLIPVKAATPTPVPNFDTLTSSADGKKLSDYFTAEYTRTVSNDNNTVTASGNAISMTAMGNNGGSGCNYEPVSTVVRLTATKNVTVTCTLGDSAKIHAPDTAQVSGTQYTVTVKKGSFVSFEVYSGNGTQNTGSVTFNNLATPGTEPTVPADCASFSYNGTFYPYLDRAIAAVGSNSGTIILEKDGKVYPSPSNGGNTITIPSNVKLLIPYCGNDTAGNFGAPTTAKITGSDRTAYRTMTLGEGIIINCAGQICVNAQQRTDVHNTGYVASQYGHIVLEKNSAINLTGSGKLFAYGYISGEGKVTAASGTEVRELIHLPGWRGGSVSKDLYTKHNNGQFNSLIFGTYYIQNILCDLEISGGAACLVHGSIMPNSSPKDFVATLLAPSAYSSTPQFVLSSNGLVKREYHADTDRMTYTLVSGKLTTAGMSMSMDGLSIDTSGYIFPLDSSMTFIIKNEAEFEISKQMKLVPEAQLIIEEGGTCTVSGSLYVYDKDQWGTFTVLANGSSDGYYQYAYSHLPAQFKKVTNRTTVNADAKLQVDGTLHITSTTGNVYSSESGGIVCGTGTIKFESGVSTADFIVHECNSRSKPSYSYVGDVLDVTFKPLIANLAGKSGLNSMSANETYTGVFVNSTDYWHEAELMQKVDATCTAEGSITYNVTGGSGLTVKSDKLPHAEVTDAAVAPTCMATGLTEGKHCSVCGEVLVEQTVVAKAEHTWDNGTVTTAATCKETGVMTYTCSYQNTEGTVCGETKTETIDKLPHTEVVDAAVAPTCTETGLTEGKHCSVCNVVLVEQTEVAANGHTDGTPVVEDKVEATCVVPGSYNSVVYCTVCGTKTGSAPQTIPATNQHNYTVETADQLAPTCTVDGYKVMKCDKCDATQMTTLKAAGHTEETIPAVAPTCTQTGLTEGVKCSVCQEILTAQNPIAALGHDYSAQITEPTCTEQGYTTYTCSACGDTYKDNYVAALSHEWNDGEETTAPDCTTDGVKTFTCKRQGCGETKTEAIPAAHDYDAGVETTAPTCNEAGVKTYTCKREGCGNTYTEAINATGHTEETLSAVAPTCTQTGLTEGVKCSVCQAVLIAQETVPVVPHEYTETVTAPTCTEQGYTTHTCKACGDTYKDSYVAANNHQPGAAPTCTDAQFCTVCGEVVTDKLPHTPNVETASCTTAKYCTVCNTELEAKKAHSFNKAPSSQLVDPATCTKKATYYVKCDNCEGINTEKTVSAGNLAAHNWNTKLSSDESGHWYDCLNPECKARNEEEGHAYSTEISRKEATCTEDGKIITQCKCDRQHEEILKKTGHKEEIVLAVAPTCTETGLTEGKRCSVCNEVLVAQETVDALGHTEVIDEAVAPDCTTTGLTEGKHCSVCGEVLVKQEVLDALGHTEVIDAAVAATCTNTGLTEGKHCSVCNAVLVAQEVVDALGHTEVVDAAKAPTCTETGLTEGKHCSVCGEILVAQEVVDALGHTEVIDEAVAPDCTNTGLTEGKHCSVCNEVLVKQEVVDALGHKDDNNDHKCDDCGSVMDTAAAQIGETYYGSLAEAVDAADEGATITLLTDINETVVIGKALTINLNGKNVADTAAAGEGFEIVDNGDTWIVQAEQMEVISYVFSWNYQVKLIEPWSIRAKVQFYDPNTLTPIDMNTLTVNRYGYYMVRQSELNGAEATVYNILGDGDTVEFNSDNGTAIREGKQFIAEYNKDIYTFQLNDPMYVVFYYDVGCGIQYSSVREVSIKSLMEKQASAISTGTTEKDVLYAMLKLEEDVTAYRGTFDNVGDGLDRVYAPALTENNLPEMTDNTEYKFATTYNVILTEPWGIRFGFQVRDSIDTSEVIPTSNFDDFGAVVFYDINGVLADKEALTVQDILDQCEDAVVYSNSNGYLTGSNGYYYAIYNKNVFTYQMDAGVYTVCYVVKDGQTYFSSVFTQNVLKLAQNRINMIASATDERTVAERFVLEDMKKLFEKITIHRG